MNLQDFISTSLETRVAILDGESLSPLFESADPLRVSVSERVTPTKFAVEDGSTRSDHVVEELKEIAIDFILTDDTRNGFSNLKQAWSAKRLVTVQTKVDSYENMLIIAIPHDETADLGMAISVPVRLMEWREVKPEQGDLPQKSVAKKKQSSTVKRGQVRGTEAGEGTERKGSILSGIFS